MKKIVRYSFILFIFTLQPTIFSMYSALRYTRQASKQPTAPSFWQQVKNGLYKQLGWQTNLQQKTITELPKSPNNENVIKAAVGRYTSLTPPAIRPAAMSVNKDNRLLQVSEQALSTKSISDLKPSFDQFQSLEQIAHNLKALESDAQQQLLCAAHLSESLRNHLMQQIKSLHKDLPPLLNEASTQKQYVSPLPQNLVNKIDHYLLLVGIDPSNVIKDYNTTKESDFFNHKAYRLEGCKLQYNNDGSLAVVKPAEILFNRAYIKEQTPEALNQEIIHAVTHLAQGHMEQIQEIQNTLGKAQFDILSNTSEMRIYKNALERNAQLLLATSSQQVAAHMQFQFVNKLLDSIPTAASILGKTVNSEKNTNLPNFSTLIQCQLSEFNEPLLAYITDFSILEKVLQQRYLIAKSNLLKKNIPSPEEQKAFLSLEKSIRDFMHIDSLVKDIPGIRRDKAIGTELQALITKEIKNMSMNPQAIEFIVSSEQNNTVMDAQSASIPMFGFSNLDFKNGEDEEIKKMQQGLPFEAGIPYSLPIEIMRPARIILSQEFIEDFYTKKIPRVFAEWIIRHELTHIKLLHELTLSLMYMFKSVKQSNSHWIVTMDMNPNSIKDRMNKIKSQSEFNNYIKAIEIQADLVPLMRDQAFTQSVKAFLNEGSLSRPEEYLAYSQLYLFHKAIQDCWKKEQKLTRTISPSTFVHE